MNLKGNSYITAIRLAMFYRSGCWEVKKYVRKWSSNMRIVRCMDANVYYHNANPWRSAVCQFQLCWTNVTSKKGLEFLNLQAFNFYLLANGGGVYSLILIVLDILWCLTTSINKKSLTSLLLLTGGCGCVGGCVCVCVCVSSLAVP